MQERVSKLESRLTAVERRLDVLEGTPPTPVTADEVTAPTLDEGFLSYASTLLGQVLLIFGGAYLLRAITDLNFVPTAVGILLGATYALFWLFMAYRRGRNANAKASALFYGGASVLLTLPLLVEATTRFGLLSGSQGIFALTIFCTLSLLVAVQRELRSLGWLVATGGIATAFVVLKLSHSAISVSMFLVLLGLGCLWAVYHRRWMGIQWLGAVGANVGVVVLGLVGSSENWSVQPWIAYLLASTLLLSYFISFTIQTHIRRRNAGIFETMQAIMMISIMFWIASIASRAAGTPLLTDAGIPSLVLGVVAYGLAFTQGTRADRGQNYYFYSTLGLGLVVAGSTLVLSPGAAAILWSIMALSLAWSSGRFGRVTLSLQCTFLLLAAGVASGILSTGFQALAGDNPAAWPPFLPWHLVIALTTVACLFIPVAQHSDRWGVLAGIPQLIVLALSVWEVGGLMVVYLAPVLAGVRGTDPNLAILAALRTAVLSASSITLALSSRFKRWPEARWLVYPVLMLVGIKLFLEDFPNGQPATLFIALALVGSALLLVAKLLSRSKVSKLPGSQT